MTVARLSDKIQSHLGTMHLDEGWILLLALVSAEFGYENSVRYYSVDIRAILARYCTVDILAILARYYTVL